jgi:hypothetical protein
VKVYKVLRRSPIYSGLYSVGAPFGAVVAYAKGKKSFPGSDCGPLAAFRTLKDAQAFVDFLKQRSTLEIWVGEGRPVPKPTGLWGPYFKKPFLPKRDLPRGSVLVESFIPEKRIE